MPCQLVDSQVSDDQKFLLIGEQLNFRPVAPCIDKYANNINLTAFIKILHDGQLDEPSFVSFTPEDIKYKVVTAEKDGRMYRILDDLRYELD